MTEAGTQETTRQGPRVKVCHVAMGDLWAGAEVQPVSYTHLRAHETVLDLVCRLLLEKKKNN